MNKFLFYLQMLPTIVALVQQVELMIPQRGKGAEKLNLVLNTVSTVAQAAPEIQKDISSDDLAAATTNIVNTTVASLKQAGVFK